MSTETYGSFCGEFLHDEEGKLIRENSLFLNIYDFWCLQRSDFMLGTYEHKAEKLERVIRKKWKRVKDLPVINILIRKLKEGNEAFDLS